MGGALGFPRALRLLRQRDFDRVFRGGSRARGTLLGVAVLPTELGHARLGLSIGKSSYRDAVHRNRARRVVREAFRLSRAELPASADIVVMGATPGAVLSLEPARAELVKLVAKAHRRALEKRAQAPREESGA